MRTEELKRILAIIAKHISSLIEAAENRARAGDSPCPTARGGLDRLSNSPSSASSWSLTAPSLEPSSNSWPTQDPCRQEGFQVGTPPFVPARTGLRGAPRVSLASSAMARSSTDTSGGTVGEAPIRTRVLRRASSIRQLFLGGPRRGGDRLVHFAEQMGLPHQLVVGHVQVRDARQAWCVVVDWARIVPCNCGCLDSKFALNGRHSVKKQKKSAIKKHPMMTRVVNNVSMIWL